MNYCTKCQSLYEKPGTCNCYAVGGVRVTYPTSPYQLDTTAAPWCPNCHGYHTGPCQRWTTCSSVSISYEEMQRGLADGSISYTSNAT